MEDHLRIGVCLWHSFAWAGHGHVRRRHARSAVAGAGRRPDGRGPDEDGRRLRVLRRSSACRTTASTTATSRPRAATLRRVPREPRRAGRRRAGYQERTGVRLLWGTANLFTHPRYQGGAATNPDPEVFAYAAAQVKHMLEVTQRLGGAELRPVGRPRGLRHAAQHRPARARAPSSPASSTSSPSTSTGSASPASCSSSPSRWSRPSTSTTTTSATVHGFLVRNGLEGEYQLNIEANHATLAGHSFHHEVAYAVANGILGSIDANRGDPQNGWDTDQFPNSVEDLVLPLYEILHGRRLRDRWLQLRRQAAPPEHRPERPLPRPHRRHRHARPGAPRGCRPDRARGRSRSASRLATPAGPAPSGRRSSAATRRSRRSRPRSPRARSTRRRPPARRRRSRTS